MRSDRADDLATVAVKGALAGAVAVWALDRVDWWFYRRESGATRLKTVIVRPRGLPPADVLAHRAADFTGLPVLRSKAAGQAIHYAIGVLPAAGWALTRRRTGGGAVAGLLYGLSLFMVQDEGLNTLLKLSASPRRYPWQTHARGLVAHLVYGLTTEIVLQLTGAGSRRRPRRS